MPSPFEIRYFPHSQKDLDEIFSYIANDNKEAALRIINEFDTMIAQLEKDPLLGQVPKNKRLQGLGYRFLNVKNYFVVYKVQDNRVEIHRVIYGWNNWDGFYPEGTTRLHTEVMKELKDKIMTKNSAN